MKNILVLLTLVGSLSIAQGQSKNDPTYSSHNYKHPNKASHAKATKNEGVANENYKSEKNVASRNYKSFHRSEEASGAVMAVAPIERNTNAVASSGNYKSAFGKRNKVESKQNNEVYSTPTVKTEEENTGN